MGCAVPAAQWADAGSLACPRTVADYCNQNVTPIPATTAISCPPPDWSTLLDQVRQYGSPAPFFECDGYDLASVDWSCGAGADVVFVYDGPSGKLTSAIELGGGAHDGQQTCLAGAASVSALDLVAAKCRVLDCFAPDSGIDTGMCDLDAGVRE
jgi:hypothetical protein